MKSNLAGLEVLDIDHGGWMRPEEYVGELFEFLLDVNKKFRWIKAML